MRRLATTTWLALHFARHPPAQRRFRLRPRLGGAEPVPLLQEAAAFALHEKAFEAVRGKADSPLPANIVWRTERRLNDPDCADKSSPGRCLRDRAQGLRALAPRLGRADARHRSATSATRVRSAIRACASGSIPGAPRRKTTSCPTRTRWR